MRFPDRYQHVSRAVARHGSRADELGLALWRTDPAAEAATASLRDAGIRDGLKSLDRLIAQASLDPRALDDHPGPLADLLRSAQSTPAWVDFDAIDRGGAAFVRTGFWGGVSLGACSLISGYASPAGNKPLALSGRLTKQAGRRLAETARFVQAVTRPGGMRRGGDGFAITLRVRLMHAQVRHLIARSGKWQRERWGEPINQHDMAATTLLFSVAVIDGVQRFGCHLSHREQNDLVALWRYVGWVMGCEEALLPSSVEQAHEMAALIRLTQGPPDDDSRALVEALLWSGVRDAPNDASARRARRSMPLAFGFCRGLLDRDVADALAIPSGYWNGLVPTLRPFIQVAELARRKLPGGEQVAARWGQRYWQRSVQMGLLGRPADFAPPEHLDALHAAG